MKERIEFIVKEPKVLYAAVAAALVLTVAVGVFVFTKNPQFNGTTVDPVDGLTVTGADMQIQLPASIGGISGCIVEEENDDVVIYHIGAQKEVGRFSRMMTKDALGLVDEGRAVLPIGYQGYNYLLRAYMGEPLMRTEHTYTPVEKVTEHIYTPADGASQGVLSHEDIYSPEGVPGTDSNDDTYIITDEDDTTYIIDDDSSSNPMLSTDWETLPLEEGRDYLPNENIAEKEMVGYLPNETITTTTYLPREVNVDEIDTGCYVYVKADFGKVQEKYREEMDFIDSELQKAAGNVIILSINRNRREQLFDVLTENRTPYVGDNAKVGALLAALPLPPTMNRKEGFSLQTVEDPYSLRFAYEMSTDLYTQEDKDMIYFNAAMLFYAI
ncbi:MAG: DUF4825 domain-containing protein, partial [Lachnospiraceae bacterium]|nr:DUF4825 domain-containing protein [Lachnospiraceae bacterium]